MTNDPNTQDGLGREAWAADHVNDWVTMFLASAPGSQRRLAAARRLARAVETYLLHRGLAVRFLEENPDDGTKRPI